MVARVGHGGGLNCTLSYQHENGTTRAYRLRCIGLVHGLSQVASESHARRTRAYYPHRRSQAQFMLTFALLARKRTSEHAEYERLNIWLKNYMDYVLNQDVTGRARGMLVAVPVRNFMRQGIPIGPLEFGEHVGSMVYNQTITFETTFEPLDTKFATSTFNAGNTDKDKNARFFYPASKQLSGNQKPDVYDVVKLAPEGSDPNGLTAGDVQAATKGYTSSDTFDPRNKAGL